MRFVNNTLSTVVFVAGVMFIARQSIDAGNAIADYIINKAKKKQIQG